MFQDPDLDYIKRNGPSYVKLGKAFLYTQVQQCKIGENVTDNTSCNFS